MKQRYWSDYLAELMKRQSTIKDGCLKKFKGKGKLAVVPEGITSIGEDAFSGCTGLTSISIPSHTEVERSTFAGCPAKVVERQVESCPAKVVEQQIQRRMRR